MLYRNMKHLLIPHNTLHLASTLTLHVHQKLNLCSRRLPVFQSPKNHGRIIGQDDVILVTKNLLKVVEGSERKPSQDGDTR